MCGIFCIISSQGVKRRIAIGLSFLEYRGYDSAGIALIDKNHKLTSIKALGKVSHLIKKATDFEADGTIGIGHTRWATHGKVTIENTHPILNENIAIVHNGTIENSNEIKAKLIEQNYQFKGDTDTEVVLNLMQYYLDNQFSLLDAFKQAIKEIKGNNAIVVLFAQDNQTIYCAKNGSPLLFSPGVEETYIASDVNALTLFVDKVISLEDGDIAVISKNKHEILNLSNETAADNTSKKIARDIKQVNRKELATEATDFPHYMLKEINEQPQVIKNILNEIISNKKPVLDNVKWEAVSKVSIIACGSSYNAGMVAKYWFETYAQIPVDIDFASEFRTRNVVYDSHALYIFVSQSGETLDTLAALKEAKKRKVKTIALVNILESSIAHLSDYIVPLQAGTEVSVASTKSFSAQLMQLANIILVAAVSKNLLSSADYSNMLQAMHSELNDLVSILSIDTEIKAISNAIRYTKHTIFLGRYDMYPIALEGALKLKELSYLPVFASAAGELKHGPIALIDDNSLVIALAPQNRSYHKMLTNIETVKARGAKVVLFTDDVEKMSSIPGTNYRYTIPKVSEMLTPLFYTIPLQLTAYQVALDLGKNVDRPRNLAKSVTVE